MIQLGLALMQIQTIL